MFTSLMDINEFDPEAERIHEAAQVIKNGGLVAFPTETVYGLGGNALDPQAAAKIYAAKGRPSDNPLIIHISDPSDYSKFAYPDPRGLIDRLAREFMPGPLTVILKKKDNIPLSVTGGLDTVAIRCPANKIANRLIAAAGVPIAAPSANTSGKPSPTKASHVIDDLNGKIDMIIRGGNADIGLESTIVLLGGDSVKLLRPGFVTVEELEAVCGKIDVDKAVMEKLRDDEHPLAPGMKYRHYAPRADVTMVAGSDDAVLGFFRKALYESAGVICFEEDLQKLPSGFSDRIAVLGARNDLPAQAKSLFEVLRSLDRDEIKRIYTRFPSREGVGLAVFNRLIKACGFHVISVQ